MVVEQIGLQTSNLTWYIALALLAGWALSLPLLVGRDIGWRHGWHLRWQDVVMSIRGLAWCGFGLGIALRFLLLAYDAETYTSPSIHLAERPAAVVDLALATAGLYWAAFVAAALLARLVPVPGIPAGFVRWVARMSTTSIIAALAVTSGCIVMSFLPMMPPSLITPVSIVGSMWVIPATTVWVEKFKGVAVSWWLAMGTLVPAAVTFVLNPYREQILVVALVILMSALLAKRKVRLSIMVPVTIGVVLVSTASVSAYRQVLWAGASVDDAMTTVSLDSAEGAEGTGLAALRRFHVLDSLLLTVDLVPDVFPFANRNVLLEGATRGLAPRLLMPDKAQSDEGLRFQTQFWSYYDNPTREEATASIAPSMPGSLYEAGGWPVVAGGAFLWALLLTLVDRVNARTPSAAAVALHVLCAVPALAGVERDFVLAFSSLMQTLIVFGGITLALRMMEIGTEPALGALNVVGEP